MKNKYPSIKVSSIQVTSGMNDLQFYSDEWGAIFWKLILYKCPQVDENFTICVIPQKHFEIQITILALYLDYSFILDISSAIRM